MTHYKNGDCIVFNFEDGTNGHAMPAGKRESICKQDELAT